MKRETWRIFTECFGYKMYVGNSDIVPAQFPWTDNAAEAELFDDRDNQKIKIHYFSTIIAMIVPGAVCHVETVS